MQNRAFGFAAMLAVMGVSIIFGMILGGRLNAPPQASAAAAQAPIRLAPPLTRMDGQVDFADIVEVSLSAVVSVTSTSRGEEQEDHPMLQDEFFRRFWFFGDPPGERDREPERRRIGSGSGFIISSDGYVMTNNHVIEDFEKVEVTTTDGESFSAVVVGRDPSIDLALLKIEVNGREMPALPLGDSDAVRVGEWVIAIGNPHEFDQTVTVGVISGKERRVPLPTTDSGVVSFIQTDAAINLGNSGGPLLDARGNVVGINTAIRRQNFAEGIGFALPINQARRVVDQLREYGEVRRGWIGIRMNDAGIDETTREYYDLPDKHGVLVTSIHPGGPAAKAGMKRDDVIRSVDGSPVRDNLDLISKISSKMPGDKVRLGLFRRGRDLEVVVKLGDREEGLIAELGRSGNREDPRDEDDPEESTGLGLKVEPLDEESRTQLGLAEDQEGLVVTEVDFGSEADAKGIQPTMVITAVNDAMVGSIRDWEDAVEGIRSGSPVKLEILFPGGEQVAYIFLRAP